MQIPTKPLFRAIKSTNGRTRALLGVLLAMAATLPATAGEPARSGDQLTVCAHLSAWAREVVPDRGSDARRLRRLHAALLEEGAGPNGPDFVFRLVALARETGVPAYFVALDAPSGQAVRGAHLAAGIGHHGRIVVLDDEAAGKPDHGRLRLLDDRTATAVLLGETGVQKLADGDVTGALEQLETALALDADMAWAWSGVGEALRRQGERERAMDAYERALELAAVRDR